jgi:VCBS repeat-containing protein
MPTKVLNIPTFPPSPKELFENLIAEQIKRQQEEAKKYFEEQAADSSTVIGLDVAFALNPGIGLFVPKEWVGRLGDNTLWLEVGGTDFTFATTPEGITVTGGLIDTLIYRNDAGDIVATITGFAPIDAAQFYSIMASDDSEARYELLTNLNDGDSVITGSEFNNADVAGTGNDVANMGAGDDLVVKFDPGDLTYDGGDGSDSLSFAAAFGDPFPNPFVQPLTIDLGTGTGQNPYGGTLTLTSVENVYGTPAPDQIVGSDGPNIIGDGIVETAGDIIDARGGDDIVGFYSLAGFDASLPGAQIDGGAGVDSLYFQYDFLGNVLDLSDQSNNAGMFRDSTFANFERFVVGSDFVASFGGLTFIGDDADNFLYTRGGVLNVDLGGGDDTLVIRSGATADGGDGFDRLIFSSEITIFGLSILDLENPANNTGAFAGGTYANFESFEMGPLPTNAVGGGNRIDFRGDANANIATGFDFADTFRGRGGDDTFRGGKGGDLYIFAEGDGHDTIIEDGLAADISGGLDPRSQTDVLRLEGLTPDDVGLTRDGDALVVTLNSTEESVRVVDHFLGAAKGIEEIQFDGVTFTRQDILDNLLGGAPNASPTVAGIINDNDNNEDSGVQVVNLLAGAADADGDTLHVANVNGLVPGMTLVGDTIEIDTNNAQFQSLRAVGLPGGLGIYQITYDIVDGNGGTVGQRAQIVVRGANDAAVIGRDTGGDVSEDGTTATFGFLSVSDVDVNSTVIDANTGLPDSEAKFVTQTDVATTYGTFSLIDAKAGFWVYTLDNDHPDVQALSAGETLTDIIPVQTLDGTQGFVTITINGANESGGNNPPTVIGPLAAGADEDSGPLVVQLLDGASDPDEDPLDIANVMGLVPGVTLVGTTLTVDTNDAAFQSLAAGVPQQIVVSYDVIDGNGGSVAQSATITVTGVNDAAAIGGDDDGDVFEDGALATSGMLTVADPDAGESAFQAQTDVATDHGTFSLGADGSWSYLLDNDNLDVQGLDAGETLQDIIPVQTLDGTPGFVTITINGADEPNAPPTVAGPLAAGADEDSGLLQVQLLDGASDPDEDLLDIANVAGLIPGITLNGTVLTVDTNDAAFQSLAAGVPQQIVVTFDVIDGNGGSVPQTATITITGVNDGAAIGGDDDGEVTEDGTLNASGTLTVADPDAGENAFRAQTDVATDYGTFSLAADGSWTYLLDNANAAVQALNSGEALTDFVTVHTAGGTAATVEITINGANESTATIVGTDGANFLNGTPSNDDIDARGGNDFAFAGGGSDRVLAGAGNDLVFGGDGDDEIHGGSGDDGLSGDAGNDQIFGDDGNDHIFAGDGDDLIDGGAGNDRISAGDGDDLIDGGTGNDQILAGNGDNIIFGGDGNDLIFAGDGDDTIFGGDGDDMIHAGAGNNFIDAGAGNDTVLLGQHAETLAFGDESGRQTVFGFRATGPAQDQIEIDSDVFNDWDALSSAVSNARGGALITFDADTTLFLLGVTAAQLEANHSDVFVFV